MNRYSNTTERAGFHCQCREHFNVQYILFYMIDCSFWSSEHKAGATHKALDKTRVTENQNSLPMHLQDKRLSLYWYCIRTFNFTQSKAAVTPFIG